MKSPKKYYYKTFNNFKKKKIFFKYYNKIKTYSESLEYAIKILSLISDRPKKKNINIYTYSNKSFEMYSSIFAILISGATWIPLSTNYPINKIQKITDQIKPDLFFFDHKNENVKKLFNKHGVKCINFHSIHKLKTKQINLKKYIKELNLNSIAFIYFTSGSTGEPKGIKISHKNIISDVLLQKKHLYKDSTNNLVFGDYYDTAFSIFFDIYFPAIFFGSIICPAQKQQEIFLPVTHIKKNNVNVLVCVPSTIQRIKDYYGNTSVNHQFKMLILTGEPFFLNLLKYMFEKLKFNKLYNCYGATEMGNLVFYHKCNKNDYKRFKKYNLVPIGKKFSTVKTHVVNGELIVQGPMISQGYLNKKLNLGKFEFNKKNKFNTSDSVINYKGALICKGRKDKMVKIRGYRVEIPEIEAHLRKLDYVKQAVVFQKESKKYHNYLISVISSSRQINTNKVRKDLLNHCPNYMIPKLIHITKTLPLNNNGKIDRKKIQKLFL